MKVLLDTNVYIGALRSRSHRERFKATFFPLLPVTVLSAVVVYELSVNATGERSMELLSDFVAPMERAGRVVTPGFPEWQKSAMVISAIMQKEGSFRTKVPHLLNDVLIAMCARKVGAEVFTYNGGDFRLIRRHLDFQLRVLEQ